MGQVFDVVGQQDRHPVQGSADLRVDDPAATVDLDQVPIEIKSDSGPPPRRLSKTVLWRRIAGVILLIALLGCGVFVATKGAEVGEKQLGTAADGSGASSRVKPQAIALTELSQQLAAASTDEANILTINGRLMASGAVVLAAISEPANAVAGQLYYDKDSNQLTFYDGSEFIGLQARDSPAAQVAGASTTINNSTGASTTINNISNTNITNTTGGGVTALNGTVGTIPTFTDADTISGSSLRLDGTTLSSVSDGLSFTTTATSGISGNISLLTGNSSTTASGNITIDTGESIIDGELVEHKTFEGGLENMTPWFGSTIAQSSEQARSGTFSLKMTETSAFWGVQENLNFPLQIASVIPGHQYYFSVWVRAATVPEPVDATMQWSGAAGTVPLTPVTDSTTGWTEVSGLSVAPAGATHVRFSMGSVGGSGGVGRVHYFDDLTVTDLSSASAFSSIDFGSSNAKMVTIGNLNQIGKTSIRGGSGIDLLSGAGNMTLNGGVMTLTGNGASSFSTTSGALTLTSAAAATWGIRTASSGVGGNLTIRAGTGALGNNDGGDLLLRGGGANGTGIGGGVIVWPQTDSDSAFIIQNSLSAPLFVADTLNSAISISGTATSFASLVLENAHLSSTQTTAPTIATPSNCGTSPSAAITPGSTDSAGSFTITTGTGGTSATCDVTVTFNQLYNATPKSIIIVGKTDAASAARQIYSPTADTASFTTAFGVSAEGADNTSYSFSYWIVE